MRVKISTNPSLSLSDTALKNRSSTCGTCWISAKLPPTRYLPPECTTCCPRTQFELSAPRMVTALQGQLRVAGLPSDFALQSFRSGGPLSKSLAGTPIDKIIQIGGWKQSAWHSTTLVQPLVRDYRKPSSNGSRPIPTRSTYRCHRSSRDVFVHAHERIAASNVSLGCGEVAGLQAADPKQRGKKFGWNHRPGAGGVIHPQQREIIQQYSRTTWGFSQSLNAPR